MEVRANVSIEFKDEGLVVPVVDLALDEAAHAHALLFDNGARRQ